MQSYVHVTRLKAADTPAWFLEITFMDVCMFVYVCTYVCAFEATYVLINTHVK